MVNEPCVSLDLLAIATKDPAANSYLQPFLWFKGFHAVALQVGKRVRVHLPRKQQNISRRNHRSIHYLLQDDSCHISLALFFFFFFQIYLIPSFHLTLLISLAILIHTTYTHSLQRISHQFWVRANHPSQLAVEALRVPKPPPTHAQAEHAKALATMLTPAEAHYSALWLQCRCSEVFGVDMHPGARLGKVSECY